MVIETAAVPQRIEPPSSTKSGLIACVVEAHPRFEQQVLRWFAVLTRVAGIAPTDMAVCIVDGATSWAIEYLRSEGVRIIEIERFDPRSPHCNKIAGALAVAIAPGDGLIALTDVDVAILEDPRQLQIPHDAVAFKTVDAPYPSLEVLMRIFEAARLPYPEIVALHYVPAEASFVTNGNGGVYIFRADLLLQLASAWSRWALWLLERRELLMKWQVHVDQVAMAMALGETGIRVLPLDVRWNLPIHVPTWISASTRRPWIIHYHDHVDARGRIRAVGVRSIDQGITEANDAIEALPKNVFCKSSYLARTGTRLDAVRSVLRRCRTALSGLRRVLRRV